MKTKTGTIILVNANFDEGKGVFSTDDGWRKLAIVCDDEIIRVGDYAYCPLVPFGGIFPVESRDRLAGMKKAAFRNDSILMFNGDPGEKHSGWNKVIVRPDQFSSEFIKAFQEGKIKEDDEVEVDIEWIANDDHIELGFQGATHQVKLSKDGTATIHLHKQSIEELARIHAHLKVGFDRSEEEYFNSTGMNSYYSFIDGYNKCKEDFNIK